MRMPSFYVPTAVCGGPACWRAGSLAWFMEALSNRLGTGRTGRWRRRVGDVERVLHLEKEKGGYIYWSSIVLQYRLYAAQLSERPPPLSALAPARSPLPVSSSLHKACSHNAGHAYAQYSLGMMYHTGQGIPQDDAKADHWHRKAAEQGHSGARGWLRGKDAR